MSQLERRQHRSANTTQALCLQLRSALDAAKLDAMVLTDEDGICLARAGNSEACDEIAAQLPLVGSKVKAFEGVLFGPEETWDIHMKRFEIEGTRLFLCAIGGNQARNDQLVSSAKGVSRILLPVAA